jgi:hypothetical protein
MGSSSEDTKGVIIRRYQGGHHQKIPRGSSSEDTKGVIIRSNKWKDRQLHGKRKNDNDPQSTTKKTED